MKRRIPDLKKILVKDWAHKEGYTWGAKKKKFIKINIKEQGTIPTDNKILEKLGIKKKDKVL